MLDLHCCVSFSLVAASKGYCAVWCLGFLLWWPLLLQSTALGHWLGTCGARAWWLHRMWCLPRPGVKPESPALAAGLLITEPPGKPSIKFQHLFRSSPGILVGWVALFLGCHSTLPRSHVTWSVTACCGCGLLGHETELLKNSSQILLGFSKLPMPLCSSPDFPLRASYAAGFQLLFEGGSYCFLLFGFIWKVVSPKVGTQARYAPAITLPFI